MIFIQALTGLFRRKSVPSANGTISVGRSHGQPQSPREIASFVRRMRETLHDEHLDIVWNPTFKLVSGGSYTATGELSPPVHEGRWQVIRRVDRRDAAPGRDHVVICTVRSYTQIAGVPAFVDYRDAEYEPVDERLLTLLRAADAANVRQFEELRRRVHAAHDAAEAAEVKINEGEAREGLSRAHFKANFAGGVGNWMGRGVDIDGAGKIIIP